MSVIHDDLHDWLMRERKHVARDTWRKQMLDNGICLRCHEAHRGGHDYCARCRREKADAMREKYRRAQSHDRRLALAVIDNWLR